MNTNKNVTRMTTGAMLVAIFGLLMLLNRQTGGMLEGAFQYLIPIPMVAYTAMYGLKPSLSAFAAMAMLAVLLGNVSTLFFEMACVLSGLVLGFCLYKKLDSTKTLLIVMFMSAAINLIDTFVISAISGVDLQSELTAMQDMMRQIAQQAGMTLPDAVLDEGYLLRILIISMTFGGALQGFIIYEVSLLLLRKLRFAVQKPRPLSTYHPPKWTAVVSLAAIAAMIVAAGIAISPEGQLIGQYETVYAVCQTLGLIANIYLTAFGIIALARLLSAYGMRSRALRVLICFLSMMFMSQLAMVLGFLYIMQLTDTIRSLDGR